MDRPVARPPGWRGRLAGLRRWRVGVPMAGGLAVLVLGLLAWGRQGGETARVPAARLTIATVVQGRFEDFIPVRGEVAPLNSVYLDSVEGGRVERRLVEAGAMVKAGQPLVELSNTELQLDVISKEAQVIEQINRLHDTQVALETHRLTDKRELIDDEYQLTTLQRDLDRKTVLVKDGYVPRKDYEALRDQVAWYRQRLALARETMDTADRMRAAQYAETQASTAKLRENLRFARRNLDSLVVRAPVDGQLTVLDAEVGQNKQRGERLGRIDRQDGFKVVAGIDEFYLGRLALGQTATVTPSGAMGGGAMGGGAVGSGAVGGGEGEGGGNGYPPLKVTKIYPQVRDGQFKVELEFTAPPPADVRSGQTVQMRLTFDRDAADGKGRPALLIPNGGFYQDTGGAWVFVLDPDGAGARRRPVRLGRHNSRSIEVLGGLEAGDRIIVSAYGDLVHMDRLTIE